MFANSKTWRPSKEKKPQRTKRNSEEAKRAKFGSPYSTGPTLAATSLAALAGQCWELVSDRVPLAASSSWAWWQPAGCWFSQCSALLSGSNGRKLYRERVALGKSWSRLPACLPPHQLVLCAEKSYPGCGRKYPAGCFYVKSHLLLLFWIQQRGRGYKLAKSIGPLCLCLVCSS